MMKSIFDAIGPEPIIKDRPQSERDAEDRWWATLTREEKDQELARWRKGYDERESVRLFVVGIVIAAFVVAPMVAVAVEVARRLL